MTWQDLTFVAFDTETTGQYPLGSEICELSAVKWKGGKIVDEFSTLLKPNHEMNAKNIEIHGITNEMVANAPKIDEKLEEFLKFIEGSVLLAHHAAFDLGFLAVDIERCGYELPTTPVVCTSLLSRNVLPKSPNHRLQTLIRFLGLEQGTAHRALDDAKACLGVGLKCFEELGADADLDKITANQGKFLDWPRFSMKSLEGDFSVLIEASRQGRDIQIVYAGGSRKGEKRMVTPFGIVRSLDGDYLSAHCHLDDKKKRFFLDKVSV